MLAPSVYTLGHTLAQLCAEVGCPMDEVRRHGAGQYAGERFPTVHDINDKLLLQYTRSTQCTRDTRQGAALVDVLEAQGDLDGALEYFHKCLANEEATFGVGHPDTLDSRERVDDLTREIASR